MSIHQLTDDENVSIYTTEYYSDVKKMNFEVNGWRQLSQRGILDPRRQVIRSLSFVDIRVEYSDRHFVWNTPGGHGITKGPWGIECTGIKGLKEVTEEEG